MRALNALIHRSRENITCFTLIIIRAISTQDTNGILPLDITINKIVIFATMKADSIKSELIQWLSGLNDKSVLASLLLFKKASEIGDWTDRLTKEQTESLLRGLSDLDQGHVMSSKDFWNSYDRKV